jgi:ribose transport system permease protein
MIYTFFQRYGIVVAFVVLFIVNAVWQPDVFLQPENLRNLINQNAAIGIIAIGMTLVIVTGGIDLSVGSMSAFCAVIAMLTLNKLSALGYSEAVSVFGSVAVCVASGSMLGAFNGLLIAYARVAPFIATLVGFVAFLSVALALADGGEIRSSSSEILPQIGRGGIPIPFFDGPQGQHIIITWNILLFVFCAIIAHVLLTKTPYGRHLMAVGCNEEAAKYAAINTQQVKFGAYTLLGVLTGIAALTLSARMNSVSSSSFGILYELDAIAAVVIGGTHLNGGAGRIWGTVLGVLLLGMITNMLLIVGVSVYWQGCVKGLIILLAVLPQKWKSG